MQTESYYGNVADLRDVNLEREVQPAGTEVRAMLASLDLEDAASKSPYFVFNWELTGPEDLSGNTFSQRSYLQLIPNDPKKPKNTAFGRTMGLCKSVLSGILEDQEQVDAYFDGCPAYDGSNGPELYAFIKDRMESVIGNEFDTSLGVDFNGAVVTKEDGSLDYQAVVNEDGTPKLDKRGVQLGKYPPKQTIGKVVWLFKARKAS